jgi:hypothetical protein
MTGLCGADLWRIFLICGAAKDGCATNAPSGHILWRTPTVRSRFVAQFVAQPLWRNPDA